jgi:hypothetical protein
METYDSEEKTSNESGQDEMAEKTRMHENAIATGAFPDPIEGRLLSITLENEKELRELRMR